VIAAQAEIAKLRFQPARFAGTRQLCKAPSESEKDNLMKVRGGFCAVSISACVAVFAVQARADTVMTVGPTGQYLTISDAVAAADADTNPKQDYTIQVMPGTYTNDFPHVTRPMTIEVDPQYAGQDVLLKSTEEVSNRKGIILTEASLIVDGLTMGAKIANSLGGNAAGIRDQNTDSAASLTIRNSTFIGNQNGILTGISSIETIAIVNSKVQKQRQPHDHRCAVLLPTRALRRPGRQLDGKQ